MFTTNQRTLIIILPQTECLQQTNGHKSSFYRKKSVYNKPTDINSGCSRQSVYNKPTDINSGIQKQVTSGKVLTINLLITKNSGYKITNHVTRHKECLERYVQYHKIRTICKQTIYNNTYRSLIVRYSLNR